MTHTRAEIPADLQADYDRCIALARSHYENFPVARLVPRRLLPHMAAVYAFARSSDDLADEGYDRADGPTQSDRLASLELFAEEVRLAAAGHPGQECHAWIFRPLGHTMRAFNLPQDLFLDLLSAFSQDVVTLRYETWDQLLDYCRRSANPVGRLVLLLHGKGEERLFAQSDAICTGLQLANFWQDVGVDYAKDRIYIPRQEWQQFAFDEQAFAATTTTPPEMRRCILDLVRRSRELFAAGRPLSRHLPFPLSWEIRLTWLGGSSILDKVESLDGNTLVERPKIGTFDKIRLLLSATFRR